MNKTRGFTVLELITALFILAMVIAIIIPLSTNIIAEQQKRAFEESEKLFISAAENYFSDKGFLTTDPLEYQTVTLKTLFDTGYIKKEIVDPRSKKPCEMTSQVQVKYIGGVKYRYLAKLICENFASKTVLFSDDLLQGYGSMVDENNDKIADKFIMTTTTTKDVEGNIQSYLPNVQFFEFKYLTESLTPGHIYYISTKVKTESSSLTLVGYKGMDSDYAIVNVPGTNSFEHVSLLFKPAELDKYHIYLQENVTSNYKMVYTKEWYIFDLTEIFGFGNEPSKEELDLLFE